MHCVSIINHGFRLRRRPGLQNKNGLVETQCIASLRSVMRLPHGEEKRNTEALRSPPHLVSWVARLSADRADADG